jgi:hypothetical protein
MIKGRNIGTVAALGVIALAFAMMTGLAGARADELSDLRANQELLQQRLDQLSQGAAPGAGTPVTSGSFPRSFVIPGTETSLRIGGVVDARANYYLKGIVPNGVLFTQGGNTQTCPDGDGPFCFAPNVPLDLHGQFIAGVPMPGGPAGGVNAQTTPAPGHSRSTYFQESAKQSQFFFDARTPTAWGEARAYIEMDFNASSAGNDSVYSTLTNVSSGWIPRIRKAYATLGGFQMGQDNGPFRDASSEGETLTSGDEGATGRLRTPSVQYNWTGLPWGVSMKFAAANPVGLMAGPNGAVNEDSTPIPGAAACTALTAGLAAPVFPIAGQNTTLACLGSTGLFNPLQNTMPDWSWTIRTDQPWGHVQLGGAVTQTTLNDGKFLNQNYLGYAGSISGDIRGAGLGWTGPWAKDELYWGFAAGEGIGGLINDCLAVTSNFGAVATSTASNFSGNFAARALYDSGVVTKTIGCMGAHASVQHWWTDQWRTNLGFGMIQQGANSLLISGNNCITTGGVGPLAATNNCGAGGSTSINKQVYVGYANMIWSPVTFIDLGLEYVYSHRVTVGNLKGDANSINARMNVRF